MSVFFIVCQTLMVAFAFVRNQLVIPFEAGPCINTITSFNNLISVILTLLSFHGLLFNFQVLKSSFFFFFFAGTL